MDEQLQRLVARCLRIDLTMVDVSLSMDTCGAWNSLRQMEMVALLEDTYQIELTFEEISLMRSYPAIHKIIAARQAG